MLASALDRMRRDVHHACEKTLMRGNPMILAMIVFLLLVLPSTVFAPAKVRVLPDEAIPKGFKTYSLFVNCNPSWSDPEKQQDQQRLFVQFEAFGDAIGKDNAAVWFLQKPIGHQGSGRVVTLDSSRSSTYCKKFHLLPSQGPHVLVLAVHPNAEGATLADRVIVALHGYSSDKVQHFLNVLTNQLLVTGLSQKEVNSEQYWITWKQILSKAADTVGGLLNRTTITIDTKFLKAEIRPTKP
jgi:hypothetical protein